GSNGTYYYHNTINIGNQANTDSNRGFYQITSASNIKFRNNIIRIIAGASGDKHAIYLATPTSAIDSDRNVFYLTGSTGASGIGFINANRPTLADWQIASNKDANSVSPDPVFNNPVTANFTPSSPLINNIAAPVVPNVNDDITGAIRNPNNPDPGAYEFNIPAIDLGAVALI